MEQALAACDQQLFDCVLLDYRMPGLDGLEGVSELNKKYPFLPIVMVTGRGDENVASEAFKRGASDYIVKRDLETGSVQRVVRNAIEKVSLQQQIEEQRQALKNFAQMLVHDLSAPIQLMRGFSGLISNAVDNEEYGSLDEYCDHLEISGKRLQELIDTLDEYNKVSGGDVTFEPVKLETAFDDAVHNLSILIEERGAKVTKDELPEVIGNRPLLAQLFQNLITNALKYCEAEVPQVHVSASEKNGRWRIAVRDNGIGDC